MPGAAGQPGRLSVPTAAAPAFEAWLAAFFAAYHRQRPVNATFIGVHTFDDRLPDLSAAGLAALADEADDLLRRLRALPRETLSPAQMLDRTLASGFLEIQRWEAGSAQFGPFANPTVWTGEAIFGLLSLLLRPFAPLEQRLEVATARLHAVPALLATAQRQIRAAPAAWLARAQQECQGATLLLEDVAIAYPHLQPAATVASEAFARFAVFLATDVTPTHAYACGTEALERLLRAAHHLATGAEAVEQLALERIALEDDALRCEPAPPGDPEPSSNDVTADPAGYLARFATLWQTVCTLATERDVLHVPDWPVRFVERPLWARRAAPSLYFLPYRSPPPYDHLAEVDYLVPPGSDASTIKLNHVVHHASLGHHVQNWFAARAASRIGQVAAVDCAARIAMLCGGTMAEGWASYAVDLADELGVLTPAERYGQHRARLRMAARAVVDVRLHQGRISLDEAVRFYTERVGLPAAAAAAEATKNSLFPGAACMYLLGWDGIWRLRRAIQAHAPATFSLRTFHDRLLSFGSVPVSLIARAMLATADADVAVVAVAALPHPQHEENLADVMPASS